MVETHVSANGRTLTVRAPLMFRRRGGRKFVVAPDGSTGWAPVRPRLDTALIRALANAHCWKRVLDGGAFASVAELADAEKVNASYLSRVLRLTLLAPDIVEAILDGRQPATLQLERLLKPFPPEWEEQRLALASAK